MADEPITLKPAPKATDRELAENISELLDRVLPENQKKPSAVDVQLGMLPGMRKMRADADKNAAKKLTPQEAMFIGMLNSAEAKTAPGEEKPLVTSRAVINEIYKDEEPQAGVKKYNTAMLDLAQAVGVNRIDLDKDLTMKKLVEDMQKVKPKLEDKARENAGSVKGGAGLGTLAAPTIKSAPKGDDLPKAKTR